MLSAKVYPLDWADDEGAYAPVRDRYFRLHAVRARRPEPCHVRPADLVGRLCAWLLGRRGLLVCRPGEEVEMVGRQLVQELDFNVADLLALLQEQIDWFYRYTEKRPTKVILGPSLAGVLTGKHVDPALFYQRALIDESVPLLGGMELVINPHVDWVVVG